MDNKKTDKLNYINKNKIFIYGEFDEQLLTLLGDIQSLIDAEAAKKTGQLTFHINSSGGYTYILWSLVAMIEEAKNAGVKIKTVTYYNAYSCGSCLAICGTEGERYISRNGEHLVHQGAAGGYTARSVGQVDRIAERSKSNFSKLKSHYKKYSKIKPKDLDDMMADDANFIQAEKCIELGLADKYIGDEK